MNTPPTQSQTAPATTTDTTQTSTQNNQNTTQQNSTTDTTGSNTTNQNINNQDPNNQNPNSVAFISQDPGRNNLVAQNNLSQQSIGQTPFNSPSQTNGGGDSTQLNQINGFGRENLSDNLSTTISQRTVQNTFGTSEGVRQFLLQIDPGTPMPNIPLDMESPTVAMPTTNVGNVGPNTLLRATANRVGGSRPVDIDIIPNVTIPWLGLSAESSSRLGPETPRPTDNQPTSTPASIRPDGEEAEALTPTNPDAQTESSRQDEAKPSTLSYFVPEEEPPQDVTELVFTQFKAPTVPTFYGVEVLDFVPVDNIAEPVAVGE